MSGDIADDKGESYFSSYEDLEIHRLMLEDGPRISAYRTAVMNNKDIIKDKCVMDVGAGTGILSILCAQAGARKVVAVEASNLANLARDVIKENKFENVIEVHQCKVEDLQLSNNDKVDIIVSEWMGFYLLHEGMLDSVIFARDNFLKEDGHLFPETASISAALCRIPSLFEKWSDVYGVSMNCFSNQLRKQMSDKPEIMMVPGKDIITKPKVICWLDLRTVTIEELNQISFESISVVQEEVKLHGLCLWFQCQFPQSSDEQIVELSTSPFDEATHWKQTVIVFPEKRILEAGEPFAWHLNISRSQSQRKYNLELSLIDSDEIDHPVPCDCWRTTCILTKKHLETMSNNILKT